MRILTTFPAAAWLAIAAPAAAQADAISIQCSGAKRSSSEDCAFGQNGQIACWGTPTISSETVFVVIDQGVGKVQIPATLFKLDGDGWIEIDQMEVGEQFISGRLNFSSFTKPRLKIDRYAGVIDISSRSYVGSSFRFSGVCRPVELSSRKF